jgi:type IV pilus assembly protein PilA
MKRMLRSVRAFTLVEVMILLLIVALLLAMAIPALQKIQQAKAEHAANDSAASPAKP